MYATAVFLRITYLLLLASVVLAFPHDRMVNNEFIRDVGVLFSQSNFTGNVMLLVTHKQEHKCETVDLFILGGSLGSVQICVPVTCIFYKTNDCTMSEDSNDYYFQGPVDIDNLQVLPDFACGSYECGSIEFMASVVGKATGALTDTEGGHYGPVVRN
ncbi:uncharacterized protein EKO05_0008709 [Ascochyta rabiei]|uniref:Uncharacterized protein n=1 Tax=Didymella rabiei TaxID=5454 RepID=A0A163G142_DIDRA|nr:uncharacterized protein EKO05_0008709 [Ascochyta rabiei]KZM24626.1 hypothetical protein ST47_g4218 [Ascochyta rabiei]UPX18407.1 hypothetical protein EKO05_0008709 [Ascochyta rabiei]